MHRIALQLFAPLPDLSERVSRGFAGATAGLGFGFFTLSPETLGRWLGLAALVVGLVCTIRRDRRESRAAELAESKAREAHPR